MKIISTFKMNGMKHYSNLFGVFFLASILTACGGGSSAPAPTPNNPPVGLPSIIGTAQEDQTLTADTSGITDDDGLGTFSYQWLRDGVAIGGATGNTYITSDADVATTITVSASYTDGQGTNESVTSAGVGPITNVNDAPVGALTITGVATEDQILTADPSGITDDDGLGAFSYQWLRDGASVGGVTGSTYVLGDADVGTQISVQVSYTDGQGTAEGPLTSAQTGPVANVNDVPVGVPTITGIATEGQTLTADTSGITDDDGLGAFSYQWLRDGATIGGATSSTYDLGAADVDTQISVQVSYTDGQGTGEGPLTSAQTVAVTTNIASLAETTCSSDTPATGQTCDKAIDGMADGAPANPANEWVSAGEGTGAMLKLTWDQCYPVTRISLYDRPNPDDQITDARITFGDGSSIAVGSLPNDGSAFDISGPAACIDSLSLEVTAVSGTTTDVGLAEIEVFGSPAGAQTPLFVERFSDGDSVGWDVLDEGPNSVPGVWSVINNAYVENSGSLRGDGIGIYGQTPDGFEIGTYSWLSDLGVPAFGAMDLRLRVRSDTAVFSGTDLHSPGVVGVMFAIQEADNNFYYRFSMSKREGYRKLEQKVGGNSFNELTTSPQSYTPDEWMTLRIVHQNGAIVVFLDGEQVAASDEPSFAGGRIGIWTSQNYAATFDDIVVYDPPAEPVIGIAPVIGGPASPGEYLVKTDGAIDVAAVVNDTALIGGVEFVADEGTPDEVVRPGVLVSNPPFTPYYSASFDPYAVPGNHEITAYALDSASDTVSQVGVLGRNLVIFGDSISDGALDNLPADDVSADLRNTSGGYATVLNDAIAAAFPIEPVTVIDEATLLDKIGDGVSKIATVLARNPQAQALLVMFGTNDAGVSTPAAFRAGMETIVNAAIAAGVKVFIAKPPPLGPLFAANNPDIELFNTEIDDLIADYGVSNPGQVFAGPDFYAGSDEVPAAAPIPLIDDIHPTGDGYATMGNRWSQIIIDKITQGDL